MSDIFDVLRAEHDRHRELLQQLSEARGGAERSRTFAALQRDLHAHAVAEERTLYAEMMATRKGQPDASHSVHEHEQIDGLVKDLQALDPDDANWSESFSKLRERVEHHEDEEEEETFEAGRKVLDAERAQELAKEFRRIKALELEDPTPRAEEHESSEARGQS